MSPSKPPQAQISTRISIRWLPEPPLRNHRYYCPHNRRVVRQLARRQENRPHRLGHGGPMPATAQESTYTPPSPQNYTCPISIFFNEIVLTIIIGRLVFTYTIDSHNNFNISDPCPFIPLPNGDDLETGAMPRSDKPGAPVKSRTA